MTLEKTLEKAKKFFKEEQENIDFWKGWLDTADSKFVGKQLENEEKRAIETIEESEVKIEALKMLIEDCEGKIKQGEEQK